MPFGSLIGNRECVGEINKHSFTKKKVSPIKQRLMINFGSLFIKILGYPEIGIRRRAPTIIKELDIEKGDRILDVGCGVGILPLELAKKYNVKVYGVDIDKEDIELAKKFKRILKIKNVDFSLGNITRLRFKSGSFDKIVCSEVLEHVSNDKKALKELKRVLKDNGKIIITTPYLKEGEKKTRMIGKTGHEREGYSMEEMRLLLRKAELRGTKYKRIYKLFSILGEKLGNKTDKFIFFPLSFLIAKFDFLLRKGNNLVVVAEKS